MKKILVPTDFSHCAEMALRYAVYIAKKTGAVIKLVHVCDLLDDNTTSLKKIIKEYNKVKIAELTLALNNLKECVEKDKVVIRTRLYNGTIVDSILTAAQEHRADVIIMGTLGSTGLKTLFFGTKTAAVINKSLIPVITIPDEYKKPAFKKLLLTLNNYKQSSKIFEPLFKLAKLFDAKLKTGVFTQANADMEEIVHPYHIAGGIKKQFDDEYPGNDIEYVHITGTDFHQAIREYVEMEKADLLIMVTHQRTFMQNLFRLSMTRQMAYHINIPLMSLPGDKIK